jgi:hypothetical protein
MTELPEWANAGRARRGDTCPSCARVLGIDGEPFCPRCYGAHDPAVRWEAVRLELDIDQAATATFGYLMHTDGTAFTPAETELLLSRTISERGVAFALNSMQLETAAARLEATWRELREDLGDAGT